MLKVLKFGGSSMADAKQFEKVKSIVQADPARRVVIVSAAGKRFSDDHKLTDLLRFLIPNYIKEGKYQLVVAIGCTGGKHRSVTLANELYRKLRNREAKYGVSLSHRDI